MNRQSKRIVFTAAVIATLTTTTLLIMQKQNLSEEMFPTDVEVTPTTCGKPLLQVKINGETFSALECESEEQVEYKFLREGASGSAYSSQFMNLSDLDSIEDMDAKFWGGHIITLDLYQKSSGDLIVADWNGTGFAVSIFPYQVKDGERVKIEYSEGAIYLSSSMEKRRKLVLKFGEQSVSQAKKLSCEAEFQNKYPQSLEITQGVDGKVIELSYLGGTPRPDGKGYYNCTIDITNKDKETTWIDNAGGTIIKFNDVEEDGESIKIDKMTDGYLVTFSLAVKRFCQQAASMASQIKVVEASKTCTDIKIPDAD